MCGSEIWPVKVKHGVELTEMSMIR